MEIVEVSFVGLLKRCIFAKIKALMIYIITYNINTSIRDYTPFYDAIKRGCMSYYHVQESTWFVSCAERQDVKTMTSFLAKRLYPGDTIFIAELTDRTQVDGWITRDFWDWYRDNIG